MGRRQAGVKNQRQGMGHAPAHVGAPRLRQEALAVLLQAARVLAVAALDVMAARQRPLRSPPHMLGACLSGSLKL